MTTYQDVLFDEMQGVGGNLGIITLNRPQALNALNHDMVVAMQTQLTLWAEASHIKAVVIQATEGRAFCAGGDLRLTYERCRHHDPIMTEFFNDEYHLNRFIFHFPKPYIAFLDGITMGGGVGISMHGSHRIATDRLMFAMPETGIGLFPDVGGTYFLPRLPNRTGYYLGLTGARINGDDCLGLGLVQHKIQRETWSSLLEVLAQESFSNDARASVTHVIEQFSLSPVSTPLLEKQSFINAAFAHQTMEDIIHALQREDEFCQTATQAIAKKSPTSLKVTLRALQLGAKLDFDSCMRQEYRLVTHFLHGHDFPEGIRAVIIDKDQNPKWEPATLAEITSETVEKYFSPVAEELT